MTCCICLRPVTPAEYRDVECWSDPGATVCVAHDACLARLGEYELNLEGR